MRIYISDIVKGIDEKTIQGLLINNKKKEMSNERIYQLVFSEIAKIDNGHKAYRRKGKRKTFILVLAATMAMGVVAGATHLSKKYLTKNEVVNEENKHLIGQVVHGRGIVENPSGSIDVYDENGKIDISQADKELIKKRIVMPPNERALNTLKEQTMLITDLSEMPFIPSGATEFVTEQKEAENTYFYPEQILINGSVSILKQTEERGWNLNAGNIVTIETSRYVPENGNDQYLLVGYILDGMMFEGITTKETTTNLVLTLPQTGEYYFYFINMSSDYLTLKKNKIEIE